MCGPNVSETSAGLCTAGKGAQRVSTPSPQSRVGTRPATCAPASVGPVALCPLSHVGLQRGFQRVSAVSGRVASAERIVTWGGTLAERPTLCPGVTAAAAEVSGARTGGGQGGQPAQSTRDRAQTCACRVLACWPPWEQGARAHVRACASVRVLPFCTPGSGEPAPAAMADSRLRSRFWGARLLLSRALLCFVRSELQKREALAPRLGFSLEQTGLLTPSWGDTTDDPVIRGPLGVGADGAAIPGGGRPQPAIPPSSTVQPEALVP